MSQEEKDNTTSQDISDAAGAKPAALSDADLDNVAGGVRRVGVDPSTNSFSNAIFTKTNYTVK